MEKLYTELTYFVYSKYLKKKKRLDVYLPPAYKEDGEPYVLVLMNDGQDAAKLQLSGRLDAWHQKYKDKPVVWVGIHADENRLHEYGVASTADYAGRGSKAGEYSSFIVEELLPFLRNAFWVGRLPAQTVFAGFSLGGLSAFDIVWHYPHLFGLIGAFSGSFWWRSKALDNGYTENDRIMHKILQESQKKPNLKFWFEVGTQDEMHDRNQNGIIDAIDDVRDLIHELEKHGYTSEDVKYVEVSGGRHNPETWGDQLLYFMEWVFAQQAQDVPLLEEKSTEKY